MASTNSKNSAPNIEDIRNLLVPTHLYYDIGTDSLKARAFGEIITKILFLKQEKKARFTEISNEAARIVGVPKLVVQDVQGGLEFLKGRGLIVKQGNFWFLKHEETDRIKIDLKSAQDRIDHILDKHFGSKMSRSVLRAWFKDVSIAYFSKFGDIWAKRLKREPAVLPNQEQIKKLIEASINQHHLASDGETLKDGFLNFLRDYEDRNVEQQIWSFAQAMLSARLVTAGAGPDPLAIKEFRDSKLLLDTNVLFTAALEKSRLSVAFSALAASIKQINASFFIINETKNEYETVVARKRAEAIRAVENYTITVLEDAKDPFLKTALSRGCVDKESFERFFDSIRFAPDKIGEEKIQILNDEEVVSAAEAGRKDFRKKAQIGAEWKAQRYFEKSKYSIEHDAALDSVLDHLRKGGGQSWIVSSDAPMQTLATRWAGSRPPTWIGIDTLIQILAISSGGPGHNPENFAPLFGTIIREDLHAGDNVYTLEDLDALLDLEDRVKELDHQEIEMFATKMRRLRMAGKRRNDSELQLEIKRTFQRKKMTTDDSTKKLEKRVGDMEENLKQESGQSAAARMALVNQIFKLEKIWKVMLWSLKGIIVLVIGSLFVYWGLMKIWDGRDGLGYFLISLGMAEFLIPLFKWVVPGFKRLEEDAMKAAEKKAIEAINNQEIK